MSSARQQLAATLATGLGKGWRVVGYPTELDAVTRPTVMVWTESLEPAEQIGRDRLRVTLSLWVLSSSQNPATADDDLDARLVDVIAVLHPLAWIAWTSAERGVLADTYHGYRITATAGVQIGD